MTGEVVDLDYESTLENIFRTLGSAWFVGVLSGLTWLFLANPGKNGSPPICPNFPTVPFFLSVLFVWSLGRYLARSYDVRYQLNAGTQQLELARSIFGRTFRTPVCEFSKLYAAATLTRCQEDNRGTRNWQYALCLVTKSARVIRVQSWQNIADTEAAEQIADKLDIYHFPAFRSPGILKVELDQEGVSLRYVPPPSATQDSIRLLFAALAITGLLFLAVDLAAKVF